MALQTSKAHLRERRRQRDSPVGRSVVRRAGGSLSLSDCRCEEQTDRWDVRDALVPLPIKRCRRHFLLTYWTDHRLKEKGACLRSRLSRQRARAAHRLILKYSLDFLRPIRTAEAFEAADWLADLPQQTWPQAGRSSDVIWTSFC